MSCTPVFSAGVTVRFGSKTVLDNVSLEIGREECVGLIGSSGCGKSTFALAAMNLVGLRGGRTEGFVRLDGRDLLTMKSRDLRDIRGRIAAMVLQSPQAAMNPALKVRTHFEEAYRAHSKTSRGAMNETIERALADVQLTTEILDRKPSQVSVGQAQRAIIAMALLHGPKLLIADEPTSALDPINQVEINDLFRRLKEEKGISILYISHDLLSVASLCDRVAIMDAGRIVETGRTADVFDAPQHPLTQALTSTARTIRTATRREQASAAVATHV
jgi:ABC-type glutathione transport system ATPase component